MEYGIIKKEIQGRFNNYIELFAEQGYCFYDVDAEERNYMTRIATPIMDETELDRKFKVVHGDAENLNEELQKAREVQNGNQ